MAFQGSKARRALARWRRRSDRGESGGPGASVRGRILLVTALAFSPTVLFASAVALKNAYDAQGLVMAAAWVTAAAIPILTGIAAVITVGLAAEGLILRWLVYLERIASAYGRGRYGLRPLRLQMAPLEFRSVGSAVTEMAAAIDERDHALRLALAEQSVLLREVHHRVKNNLQIVGSLLSLQASRTADPNVRSALRDALVRIDTLALSQRFMKPTEDKDTVSSAEIFGVLTNQLRARLRGSARPLAIELDVQDITIDLDFAGRLALVVSEILLVAARHAGDDGLRVCLSLRADSPDVIQIGLRTRDGRPLLPADASAVSLGLIDGYLRQVGGRLDADDAGSALTLHARM